MKVLDIIKNLNEDFMNHQTNRCTLILNALTISKDNIQSLDTIIVGLKRMLSNIADQDSILIAQFSDIISDISHLLKLFESNGITNAVSHLDKMTNTDESQTLAEFQMDLKTLCEYYNENTMTVYRQITSTSDSFLPVIDFTDNDYRYDIGFLGNRANSIGFMNGGIAFTTSDPDITKLTKRIYEKGMYPIVLSKTSQMYSEKYGKKDTSLYDKHLGCKIPVMILGKRC